MTAYYHSPIGAIRISASEEAIESISFVEEEVTHSGSHPLLREAVLQLDAYFTKRRTAFDLPLTPAGTDFQKSVWDILLHIPFGEARTYLSVAKELGDEKVIRAAASANGKNPIAIVIPCHRIIGSDGSLTGYAGGLWRKQRLLEHEGILQPSLF